MKSAITCGMFLLLTVTAVRGEDIYPGLNNGKFKWNCSAPQIAPKTRGDDECVSVKDPSIVFYEGNWHIFCTVRFKSGKVGLEYISFADWDHVGEARRELLKLHEGYHAAPQIFYFRPQQKWYLIFQMADEDHGRPWGPYYSTNSDIGKFADWTAPKPLFEKPPKDQKWLDFWIICYVDQAHLFFTSLDGRLWRSETKLTDFPGEWSQPEVVLKADIFEASQTYRLKGTDQFLTIVEAQGNSRRYYKAYVADRLDGQWKPLADTGEQPFAAFENVVQDEAWTNNISHGELIRAGFDERLEVDPSNLQMLFQGANDQEYRGNKYGMIPWRLGLLTAID